MKEKLLVSGCLVGQKVRYDGGDQGLQGTALERWITEGRVVPFCPEVAGGLPIPRAPAEIVGLRVRTRAGVDVTEAFESGAEQALELARRHGIRVAVLKERSPSCGSSEIYDGTFSGTRKQGEGITTSLLRANGVEVYSEAELHRVETRLEELESGDESGKG